MSRSFTVSKVIVKGKVIDFLDGRYLSQTPAGASKKVFSQVLKAGYAPKSTTVMTIHIDETTRDSNKKTYKYKVKKERVDNFVEIGGETVHYKFITHTKSIK